MQQKERQLNSGATSGSYKNWDASDVADWLSNQIKLPQYGKVFGKK